jgi:hypothetical protein
LAQAPAVEVQVYDYADMKPGSLQEAVALTQEILAGAGLSIRVNVCRPIHLVSCDSESGITRRLLIRVVPGAPKTTDSVLRLPLARSVAGREGGTYATVFLQRVKDAAAEANVPWDIVLAYATVHETWHLLLGAEAHTVLGLMKARWNREDYQAMNQHQFHFSEQQAHELANRFGGSPSIDMGIKPSSGDPVLTVGQSQ